MKRISPRNFLTVALISFIVSGIVTAASSLGWLDGMQKKALDLFIWWKGEGRMAGIVIVAIDEETFEQMGSRQPLPRVHLANLLLFLETCGARVIGLDVELKTGTSPRDDKALLAALGRKVVVPYDVVFSGGTERVMASPLFRHDDIALKGFANTFLDGDGAVRDVPLRLHDQEGNELLSFAAILFGLTNAEGKALPDRIRIDYAGPAATFPTYSAAPLLMIAGQNIVPAADNPFRDKIVFVGGTFRAGRDTVLTPKGMMSGVEVQANILNTLLTDSHIRTPHWTVNFALQVVLSITFGLIFFLFRSRTAMLLSLGLIFLVMIPASYYLFLLRHYWIDFIIPVITVKLTGSMIDRSERKRIRRAFSSYVSREVMQCVYNDAALLEGQRTVLTVLFADIRGFTALSETLPPEQLSTLLNEYYAFMTDAVVRNNGVVNKFIGDAVLAIYGAPIPRKDHANGAVATAQAMLSGMAQLNARLARQGLPSIAIGIGIHTGPAFAGNIGTAERKEYAVAGDTVNTASRLEGMNKDLGTACLVSDAVLQQLGHRPAVSDMGEISIRGRRQPLRVYALTPEQEE